MICGLALVFLAGQAPAPAPVDAGGVYRVESSRSSVVINVGKSGLMSFAGHEHVVRTSQVEGEVLAVAEDLARSTVRLSFAAAALKVQEQGEPAGDAPKVEAAMLGPKVLDVARFPTIQFASTSVSGRPSGPGTYDLEVAGDLTLHGVTRRVTLPLRVVLQGESLTATGRLSVRQTDYGISPVSVAGVVKVKDALAIDYQLAATRGLPVP
jgi:polyisoprenoid-binding protein YceI